MYFSPSLYPFLSALFMSPLLPVSVHLLLHCWLMVLQLLLCSHDLSVTWGNIKGSIFIYFSSTSLTCHDCEIWKFFCSYRMTFVYAIATWKHRNNAGWTIFPHLLISASKFSCRHIHFSSDLFHIIIGFLILSIFYLLHIIQLCVIQHPFFLFFHSTLGGAADYYKLGIRIKNR